MELVIPDKSFICIDYPGDVDNIDKAIDTLGGLKVLHKVLNIIKGLIICIVIVAI